ncbi:MAG: hypothetical protein VX278_14300 [Myxococcota bacterium]|nr:hypothetical protein [Myxococcota bacterium]
MLIFLLSTAFGHPQYTVGMEAMKRKDFSTAERSFRRCVEDEPQNVQCHWELGWAHWVREEWTSVVRHWTMVQTLDPNFPKLTQYLPQAEAKLEKPKQEVVSVKEIETITRIYHTEGCDSFSDTMRSRVQKFQVSIRDFLFIVECRYMDQGPFSGKNQKLLLMKQKKQHSITVLQLPFISLKNRVKVKHLFLGAAFEDCSIREYYTQYDWKISNQWQLDQNGEFFLHTAKITHFNGKKKLDYLHGSRHRYKE